MATYAFVPAPNGIFITCPCALRTKTTLEKVHFTKILLRILYCIYDSPSKFGVIPLRSSCVLALQNPYLGPAMITWGFIFFIFFAHRKLKLNYAKAFITFDPLISFFISPTFQL